MNYHIDFTPQASKIVKKWKKSNPIAFKKLFNLLPELEQHPRTGTGHPEPLKGGNNVIYSRHITKNDRIIYEIYDDKILVLIVELEGHYDDK